MPESSGRVLTAWLAKERPDVKVILMSGFGERVQEEGVVFMEKPFRQRDLLEKVRATIDA
jgi:FixJ family two-component response regulator